MASCQRETCGRTAIIRGILPGAWKLAWGSLNMTRTIRYDELILGNLWYRLYYLLSDFQVWIANDCKMIPKYIFVFDEMYWIYWLICEIENVIVFISLPLVLRYTMTRNDCLVHALSRWSGSATHAHSTYLNVVTYFQKRKKKKMTFRTSCINYAELQER
jgi:hypothetical protein